MDYAGSFTGKMGEGRFRPEGKIQRVKRHGYCSRQDIPISGAEL
jgi:hypothetical protein